MKPANVNDRPHLPGSFYDGIKKTITRYGRQVLAVGENPMFGYTIGNFLVNRPELIVFGAGFEGTTFILNKVSKELLKDENLTMVDLGGKYPVMLHTVINPDAAIDRYLVQAGQYFGHRLFKIVQVLIPDLHGRFPNNPACDEPFKGYPLL